jgi:hypothetical protein
MSDEDEIASLEKELQEMRKEPGEWYKIGLTTENQEEAIRTYARLEGFEDLRGYWAHLASQDWDYYDVLRHMSP